MELESKLIIILIAGFTLIIIPTVMTIRMVGLKSLMGGYDRNNNL